MVIVIDGVTVAEADTYFETRLNSGVWTSAQESEKLAALTTASVLLDDGDWAGVPAGADAAFPRTLPGASEATTPSQVKWGVYEEAIHLLTNPSVLAESETVEDLVVGPIELDMIGNIPLISSMSSRYLGNYTVAGYQAFTGGGGAVWWRRN